MHKRKKNLLLLISLFILSLPFFLQGIFSIANADSGYDIHLIPDDDVFGGRVTATIVCDCSNKGTVLTIGFPSPRPHTVFIGKKSRSYEYRYTVPLPDDNVLGTIDGIVPGVCTFKAGKVCKDAEYLAEVELIGSSQPIPPPTSGGGGGGSSGGGGGGGGGR